jgi:hypothetical protein
MVLSDMYDGGKRRMIMIVRGFAWKPWFFLPFFPRSLPLRLTYVLGVAWTNGTNNVIAKNPQRDIIIIIIIIIILG